MTILLGWVKRTGNGSATADPPFDFAQGRLFGDDNKKAKGNGSAASLF
jgi:hypothetical protein